MSEPPHPASSASRARRLPWADLLRRVFADDVLQCPCGGRRSIVAIVTDATLARSLLACIALTLTREGLLPRLVNERVTPASAER